jgi:hypothetical protein
MQDCGGPKRQDGGHIEERLAEINRAAEVYHV